MSRFPSPFSPGWATGTAQSGLKPQPLVPVLLRTGTKGSRRGSAQCRACQRTFSPGSSHEPGLMVYSVFFCFAVFLYIVCLFYCFSFIFSFIVFLFVLLLDISVPPVDLSRVQHTVKGDDFIKKKIMPAGQAGVLRVAFSPRGRRRAASMAEVNEDGGVFLARLGAPRRRR